MLYVSVNCLLVVRTGKPNQLKKSKTQRAISQTGRTGCRGLEPAEAWKARTTTTCCLCSLTGETKFLLSVLSVIHRPACRVFMLPLKATQNSSLSLLSLCDLWVRCQQLTWPGFLAPQSKRNLEQEKELRWTSWVRYPPLISQPGPGNELTWYKQAYLSHPILQGAVNKERFFLKRVMDKERQRSFQNILDNMFSY